MRPSRWYRVRGWLAVVVLLGLMWPVQLATYHNRVKAEFRTEVLPYFRSHGTVEKYGEYLPGESATIAFMGGFRNMARTLLWMKVDELWHGGRWYRMLPVMVAVTRVDPQFITIWETFGWHLAWNLNAAAKEQSMEAARELAALTGELHELGGAVVAQLPRPLAADLADAQRDVATAAEALDQARADERRLDVAMSRLQEGLKAQRYAWERVAALRKDVDMSQIADTQRDLLATAEGLIRSRREENRWVQEGIDTDKAGIRANPDRYEMYWELSWLYFDRIKEYHRAEEMLLETLRRFPANRKATPERQKMVRSPFYVYHTLAHCYEYQLEVDKAIVVWKRVMREVSKHPVPEVPERSLRELETWGDDPAWGIIMIHREQRIRESRFLPPWNYTSARGKAALAWWAKNESNPEAIERVERLKLILRGEPPGTKKPKRRFERDESHGEAANGTT